MVRPSWPPLNNGDVNFVRFRVNRKLLVFSLKLFKAWVRDVEYSIVEQLYLLLYLFYQAESFPDYNARRPAFP